MHAQTIADQVVVHRSHRQQGGNVGEVGPEGGGLALGVAAIAEHQHGATRLHHLVRPFTEGRHRHPQAGGAGAGGVEGGEGGGGKARLVHQGQLHLVDHGAFQLQQMGELGLLHEQVPPGPQLGGEGHHQPFPQGVDGRVGDLGEALLKVVVEQVGFFREHRQGNVIPHAIGGLLALGRHVLDDHVHVFGGVAKGVLLAQQLRLAVEAIAGKQLGGQLHPVLGQPLTVGMALGHPLLDRPIFQNLVVLQIHQDHLTGAEAALFHDLLRGHRQHPGFGRHHQQALPGNHIAGRPQAVAV